MGRNSGRRLPPPIAPKPLPTLENRQSEQSSLTRDIRRGTSARTANHGQGHVMQHSTKRILTTHAGSLPRPADLLDMLAAKEQGQPVDEAARAARLPGAVKEIVQKQIELGIDIVDDGEYSKPSFVTYVNERLGGFEVDSEAPRARPLGRLARGAVVPGVLRGRSTSARGRTA